MGNLIADIRIALKQAFPGEGVEEHYKIRITETADITGDGVPEALVYLGTGGAYTDELTLMRVKNGKPVVARFKQKKGGVSPLIFLSGSSVRHQESVKMLPDRRAIYSMSSETDDSGRKAKCGVVAYEWTAETQTFDWNRSLSGQLTESNCRD
ncbi:MAG TPA: hypothetical protein VHS34_15265 [Terriglobales bacterium]|jgi:hypothetical protein|nr:hypothetical protein [Terriglobales bacterium]